ncbi:hypothetical protein C8J57DRAFT_1241714 [Mycena rebaudengoi]|nr:hypothetical protein C8J57DRAFT_1241714 [Mycena rebaudengoi]
MGERGRKVMLPVAREELAMDLPQTAKLCAGGEGQEGPREQRRAHRLIGTVRVEYKHQCEQLDVGECCRNLGEGWRKSESPKHTAFPIPLHIPATLQLRFQFSTVI